VLAAIVAAQGRRSMRGNQTVAVYATVTGTDGRLAGSLA
jgi:hypothetical protein